jgi:type II restriction enzyme
MSKKNELRVQRAGTVININSKKQESRLKPVLERIAQDIAAQFEVTLEHQSQWFLKDIVVDLQARFAAVDFHYQFATSSMRPDGGILSIVDSRKKRYPILITEVKNQGTNDLRLSEGKLKQAKGNAIERLGKNVIGFRTALLHESIFPFVCFGDGCDFDDDSSILDRVITINMFGHLNKVRLHNEGQGGQFNRGSFFFRRKEWTEGEMLPIMKEIALNSVYYYFSKYGKDIFTK